MLDPFLIHNPRMVMLVSFSYLIGLMDGNVVFSKRPRNSCLLTMSFTIVIVIRMLITTKLKLCNLISFRYSALKAS